MSETYINIGHDNYLDINSGEIHEEKVNRFCISIGYILSDDDYFDELYNNIEHTERKSIDYTDFEEQNKEAINDILNKYPVLVKKGIKTGKDLMLKIDSLDFVLTDEEIEQLNDTVRDFLEDYFSEQTAEHLKDFGYYGYWGQDDKVRDVIDAFIHYNQLEVSKNGRGYGGYSYKVEIVKKISDLIIYIESHKKLAEENKIFNEEMKDTIREFLSDGDFTTTLDKLEAENVFIKSEHLELIIDYMERENTIAEENEEYLVYEPSDIQEAKDYLIKARKIDLQDKLEQQLKSNEKAAKKLAKV